VLGVVASAIRTKRAVVVLRDRPWDAVASILFGVVWQYQIMPLLEDLFYGQSDLDEHYGLPSLRKAIAAASEHPEP
jgi:hypothetical protein